MQSETQAKETAVKVERGGLHGENSAFMDGNGLSSLCPLTVVSLLHQQENK